MFFEGVLREIRNNWPMIVFLLVLFVLLMVGMYYFARREGITKGKAYPKKGLEAKNFK